jgi:peptide/nickel transport system ATP-binding protein
VTDAPLLSVRDLARSYPVRRGWLGRTIGLVRAVDGVSFEFFEGESLGLVGESGSGKTTLARLLLRLEEPTAGRIFFDGEDWLALGGRVLRRKRRDIQMVFQDPATSLNPRMTVGDQIAEPLLVQRIARGRALRKRVSALLEEVGLDPRSYSRYPHELSGGERQRVGIARALATEPRLLVCDEPVSALDVSVAAGIVNLLLDLGRRRGLSLLFIAHDLAVVGRVADRVAVMYLGRIVEEGEISAVLTRPLHPYTAALLSAVPEPLQEGASERIPLRGEPASAAAIPPGCRFHPRCPIAQPRCAEEAPSLAGVSPGRKVACFFPGEMQNQRNKRPVLA